MKEAKRLIQKYADSKFVITSRIHCALPCLAVETPCLFVTSSVLESDKLRSKGRFGGLLELFHLAEWKDDTIIGVTNEISDAIAHKISSDTVVSIKEEYKVIRDDLNKRVGTFIHDLS